MYPIPRRRHRLMGWARLLSRRARSGALPQTPEFFALVPGWPSASRRRGAFSLPGIPASGSALGSLSSVALSSVRLLVAPKDSVGAIFWTLSRQPVVPVILNDPALLAGLGDRQLRGTLAALDKGHDVLAQLAVPGFATQLRQSLGHIHRRDFVPGRYRRRPRAGRRKPQRVRIEFEQAWRLGSGIPELKAQLDGGELRSRSGQQQITVADGVQGAGAAEGAADLVATDGFSHVMDHDEGGAGSFAQAQQTLAQGRHGAGVVFILIVGGVERVQEDDVG